MEKIARRFAHGVALTRTQSASESLLEHGSALLQDWGLIAKVECNMLGLSIASSKTKVNWPTIFRRSATWLLFAICSLAVVLLLLVLAGVFHQKVPNAVSSVEKRLRRDSPVATVERIRKTRHETAVGTIKPVHESKVAAKILARVLEVKVIAGQKISEGDVLVRLSDDELIARLKQAEAARDSAQAQLRQAKSEADRASQLISKNAISQAEYDQAKTLVLTSQAQLELALRRIDEARVLAGFATIAAPFSGVVIDKDVEPGDTVSPGQTLLTIYDPTHMQLVANVRDSLAMKLKVGQQLPAKLESLGYECSATVSEIVPLSDVSSHSFEVKVTGPCPPGVYSGMFGRLMLPLDDEELLVIPKRSIERVGQLTLVTVASGDREHRRSVQLGRDFGDRVEVLSGLREGEQIVASENASAESSQ